MTTDAPPDVWDEVETLDAPAPARGFWAALRDPVVLAGLLDAGVVLLFVAGLNVGYGLSKKLELWYAFITIGKLVLLATSWNQRAPLSGPAKWLIGSTTVMVLATTVTGVGSIGPYIAVASFLVNLALTSMLIGRAPVSRYLVGPALLITATAVYHIVLCQTHRMPTWFGRYFYFGANQFNLGGELEIIACFAAAFSLPRLIALPVLAILLYDMNLMQARSAIVAGFFTFVVMMLFDGKHRLTRGRAIGLLMLAPVAALVLVGAGAGGKIADAASNVLLLHDSHRGIESGGSGRADLWEWSFQLFEESPIVGHDLSYFDSIGFIGSHNLFIYGLAQYGLMSLFFVGSLIYSYVMLLRRDIYRFAILFCALPLLLFNDRFTSMNPYPFMFFVLLTKPSLPQEDTA
jgi:hypothetical protein